MSRVPGTPTYARFLPNGMKKQIVGRPSSGLGMKRDRGSGSGSSKNKSNSSSNTNEDTRNELKMEKYKQEQREEIKRGVIGMLQVVVWAVCILTFQTAATKTEEVMEIKSVWGRLAYYWGVAFGLLIVAIISTYKLLEHAGDWSKDVLAKLRRSWERSKERKDRASSKPAQSLNNIVIHQAGRYPSSHSPAADNASTTEMHPVVTGADTVRDASIRRRASASFEPTTTTNTHHQHHQSAQPSKTGIPTNTTNPSAFFKKLHQPAQIPSHRNSAAEVLRKAGERRQTLAQKQREVGGASVDDEEDAIEIF